MTSEFNLLDEKWILVMDDNGKVIECNLKEVFEKAHEVRKLAGEIPTQDAAIFRFLLAVLYAVYQRVDENGNPCEMMTADDAFDRWEALWNKGRFDTKPISDYLESYRDRFFLFHPTRPFYQIPLEKGTEYLASKLNGALTESNNKPRLFSSASGTEKTELKYGDAARWLLNANAFDDASLKKDDKSQELSACGVGWLGKLGFVMVDGGNLFRTLLLNLVLVSEDNQPFPQGIPAWEFEEAKMGERTPIPTPSSPVEILTLQSRRIKLKRDKGVVTGYHSMGGDIVDVENVFVEQMTVWRKDKKGNIVPRFHEPSKSMWRDYGPLMIKGTDSGDNKIPGVIRWTRDLEDRGLIDIDSVTISIAGVKYADKNASVEGYICDSMDVNSGLLAGLNMGWNVMIEDVIRSTEKCASCLWIYARDVSKICGCSDKTKHMFADKAKSTAYMRLDRPFRHWIREISPDTDSIDDKRIAWMNNVESVMRSVAKEILDESGERMLTGKDGESVFTAFRDFSSNLRKEIHGRMLEGERNE